MATADAVAPTASMASPNPDQLAILALITPAKSGRLLVYAGAGISFDSHLPSGGDVAQRLHSRLVTLGFDLHSVQSPDDRNLLAVTDAALAVSPGCTAVLQQQALETDHYSAASPANVHKGLALLVLENGIELMTTNWDLCIEKGASPEILATVVTEVQMRDIAEKSLLKAHGCARSVSSVVVTRQQLLEAPLWAQSAVAARLSTSTVVFLGIGDVAPYVRLGLNKLQMALGSIDNAYVVFPEIDSQWTHSSWPEVLPKLAVERRLGLTADQFVELLLSAWLKDALIMCEQDMAARLTHVPADSPDPVAAFVALRELLLSVPAHGVLRWMRGSYFEVRPGLGVAHSTAMQKCLLALAMFTFGADLRAFGTPAMRTSSSVINIIAAEMIFGSQLDHAVRAKVDELTAFAGPGDKIQIICSGLVGSFQPGDHDIVASARPDDILDTPDPEILFADRLLGTP